MKLLIVRTFGQISYRGHLLLSGIYWLIWGLLDSIFHWEIHSFGDVTRFIIIGGLPVLSLVLKVLADEFYMEWRCNLEQVKE